MDTSDNGPTKKFRCWVSKEEEILSFHYVEGYELKEFDTHEEFQDFYYRTSYWGYRVQ